ncbi:16S rRNA (uracil1498-N3)-methyltransferase [Nitrosomonas sp. PY1]|uniref:16S rRNA (uracil(1498)-N(3))-methyltransferase n=1 Tax=Nitrosomonas sp. PY1 TaxID=1803906 RepID=UPI001FC7EDAB|nr:16S rRNA (uracil(1498)-N(3))-methyltransferase [Nitrosomonas sp. PY1]GKS68442.1 16S rRNA (uracil1498-N3)-methyltransferase [Nitrosomonas sp. PY1]
MHARFYHPAEITVGQCIALSHENKHHAMRTLRLKKGDSITLFNGRGGEFSAHIQVIDNSDVKVLVENFLRQERESPVVIELAQAICTNEKMDWIIQKAVELGVNRIQPISTERSIVQLSNERASKRLIHWEKIIISACEQSGRNHLPQIFPLISLSKWLNQKQLIHTDRETRLMLSPTSKQYLKNIARPVNHDSITLMVGPEGGFSQTEELSILHSEYTSIRLGSRILRTETAGLAIIAAIQTLWGDF